MRKIISSAISMLGQDKYERKTVSLSKDYVQSIGGFKVLPDYDVASVPDDCGALTCSEIITDWYSFHKSGVYTAPIPEM